jgi:hypothetical protein
MDIGIQVLRLGAVMEAGRSSLAADPPGSNPLRHGVGDAVLARLLQAKVAASLRPDKKSNYPNPSICVEKSRAG